MTIKSMIWPDEKTRTETNSCLWHSVCEVGGVRYEEKSRRGSSEKLSRALVAAGISDQPIEVWVKRAAADRQQESDQCEVPENWMLAATYPSFHAAAKFTYGDSATTGLRRGRFVERIFNAGVEEE